MILKAAISIYSKSIIKTEESSKDSSKIHKIFTKVSIQTPKREVYFEQVQVDLTSLFNFVPWSITRNLDLVLYISKLLIIKITS
jgi:hypothetical protein